MIEIAPWIELTDGYKVDHRRQYPRGTQRVLSNLTPRGSRIPDVNKIRFVMLQPWLQEIMMRHAQDSFFLQPKRKILDRYARFLDDYLGPNDIGVEHIGLLHDYGTVPLRFCAVPEGMELPLRVPPLTVENTHDDFFWLTNYYETCLSDYIWGPCAAATTAANRYYRKLMEFANASGDPNFVQYQCHDFAYRGLIGTEATQMLGGGHMMAFVGTDNLPAMDFLRRNYDATGLVGCSVAATEHAVMCAGGEENELDTINRLLDLYPRGILSVVSDTWDFWDNVMTKLPKVKDRIMSRDGKYVVRPDSGDPVKIICGDPDADTWHETHGLIVALWEIFGGTINEKGYRVLDPHIGAIYGDSITPERAVEISLKLMEKGYASTNIIYGVGSYTYQYVTRDTFGFAIKATWAMINDKEHLLYKSPKTDVGGVKKSAKGRMILTRDDAEGIKMIDGLTLDQEQDMTAQYGNLLQPVWEDGQFLRRWTLDEVRAQMRAW